MLSATTPRQILNNPSNDSTAKFQWSFSKAQRFRQPKIINHSVGFQGRNTISPKRSSFGFGNRSKLFDGIKQTISPATYQIVGNFSENKKISNKGFSFGCNRDQLNFSNYLKFQTGQTPAPHQYQYPKQRKTRGRCYSMRSKTSYPKNYFLPNDHQSTLNAERPGPGKYQTIDILGKKYMTSKFKNGGFYTFKGRINNRLKSTPGPGQFIDKTIDADGHCVLSTMKSTGRRHFSVQKRQLRFPGSKDDNIPGPGQYRKPSDFGHYQGKLISRPQTARH